MRKFGRACGLAMLGLAACMVASFGAAPAEAATLLRVGKAIAGPFDFTPLDVGMKEGFFAKHGLKIEEVNFNGSAKLQQGLAADAVDIGLGSGPELSFVAKGNTDLGICAFAGPPAGLVLVVRSDDPVKTVADLKGKKIGVSTVGGLTDWMVREVSRQQGWGPDGIDVTPLGADAAQIAAMLTHQLDGMALDVAHAAQLQQQGKVRVLLRFKDYVPHFINHIAYATDKVMKDHPDEVRAFLAAWFETIKWMRQHKAETVKIAAPVMHQPPAIVAYAYDQVMPSFSDTGKFDPKGLAVLARSFVQMKLLPKEPDMSKLYTEKFLPGQS